MHSSSRSSFQLAQLPPLPWGKEVIETLLPHRDPMLWVDQILEIDLEKETLVGERHISERDSWIAGHFPGKPLCPGVLLIESLGQAGIVLLRALGERRTLQLLSLREGKFRRPVSPGQSLILRISLLRRSFKAYRLLGLVEIGGALVCESQLCLAALTEEGGPI